MLNPRLLEKLEVIINRGTDGLMIGNLSRSWMRWSVIPPDMLMDRDYIFRSVRFQVVVLALAFGGIALSFPAFVLIVTWIRDYAHHGDFAADFRRLISDLSPLATMFLPWIGLAIIVQIAGGILDQVPRAYFWNRRARRLQSEPPIPSPPLNDGEAVWPPPPRAAHE